jgi:hypothetical protein
MQLGCMVATSLNLWYMPMHYQVLFSNLVGFFWNIFLCFITSSHGKIHSAKTDTNHNLL